MSYYSLIIFGLGLLALLFNIFDIFDWFVPVWSIILMLLSFSMLLHVARKERQGEKEALKKSIEELEARLKQPEEGGLK